MSQVFFWSDPHFFHSNIIKLVPRLEFANKVEKKIILDYFEDRGNPEKELLWKQLKISDESTEKMNKRIISNFNSRVKPGDTTYCNGDVIFKGGSQGGKIHFRDIEKLLNGKIIFYMGNHDCFSEETLLLTKEGYKNYKDLKIGELIPTINLEKQIVEYKPIKEIIINPVKEAYTFKKRASEGCFSENHELVLRGYNQRINDQKTFKKLKCKEVWNLKSPLILPSAFKSGNKEYNISDDYLELLGWIFTDGSIEKKYGYIQLWQSKEKGKMEIESLLNKLKIKYNKKLSKKAGTVKFISGKKLKSSLDAYAYLILPEDSRKILKILKIKNKYEIPDWLFEISDRQMNVLIDAMVKGCGTICSGGSRVIWKKVEFLRRIQGLCVVHNIGANVVQWNDNTYYLCVHKKSKESTCESEWIELKDRKIIKNYNKLMWCVNVENHNIFTSLNGKSLITGNSKNSVKCSLLNGLIDLGGKYIFMSHKPPIEVPQQTNLILIGHVHKAYSVTYWCDKKRKIPMINMSVEMWNYYPVTINEILARLARTKNITNFKEKIDEKNRGL